MDKVRKVLAPLRTKSGKKLAIVSVVLAAVLMAILMLGTFVISSINQINMLSSSISALPDMVQERNDTLDRQYTLYTSDYLARGELATALYNYYEDRDQAERLELIRQNSGALSATLLDSEGKLVASTSPDQPSLAVTAAFDAMDHDDTQLFDPNMEGINTQIDDEDGYVPETDSMPMVFDGHPDDGNILMLEFDYTPFAQVLVNENSWDDLLNRALAGIEGCAFIMDADENLAGYPLDELDEERKAQLHTDVVDAFKDTSLYVSGPSVSEGFNTEFSVIKLLDRAFFAVRLSADANELSFMLAVPVSSFAGSMVMCDVAIITLVVVGFILFARYATMLFRMNPIQATDDKLRKRMARRNTKSGILAMLAVTGILASMLLMIEGMSNTAKLTVTQQMIIKYDLDYRTQRKNEINDKYSERYTTRASAIAKLLSDHPNLRTRETLSSLAKLAQVEYLMLFDKSGNELFSSNGYSGFTMKDESTGAKPQWKPVLQGYSQVETPTEKNSVTGTYERTIATLVKDADGLPDGFVVMVVNDEDYMSEIGNASLEGVVDDFTTRKGQVAAVVDNETGLFTAHTTDSMIGETAANYLDASLLGRDFEGYTTYDGNNAYASCVSTDGKTTLVITNTGNDDEARLINWVLVGFILLIILLVFYPAATSLCARYLDECPKEKHSRAQGHPAMVLYYGYDSYVAVLAVTSVLGVMFGFWRTFEYVYAVDMTPGLHLFSIWYALFIFAVLSCVAMGLHRLIGRIDEQANTRTRTFASLADSLFTYAISIFMVIRILSVLGVDTAAIIGSISIVTLAIGMGTQDLVKDIVAGLFLIFEGTISVGDIVEIGGWHGRVTNMGIRTTEITNDSNDVKIFTNSRVGEVVNMSKEETACTEEFTLPRTVEVAELPNLVASYIATLTTEIPALEDSLKLDEITNIAEDSYTIRLSYLVNENDRKSVSIRLRNAMLLLLEENEEDEDETAAD